jgi:hypothetical protein
LVLANELKKVLPESEFSSARFQNLWTVFELANIEGNVQLTILSSPYTFANCLATSWVPSGLASSTTITSHAS